MGGTSNLALVNFAEAMASALTLFSYSHIQISPSFPIVSASQGGGQFRFRTVASKNLMAISRDSFEINGAVSVGEKEKKTGSGEEGGNETLVSRDEKKKTRLHKTSKEVELFGEDGYGISTVKDYIDTARDLIKPDGGPPRWFCPVECGSPMKDSPLLLFLPGMDGVGSELILHTKTLGKVFEVRCLHIPVNDRTPLEGLLNIIETIVKLEHNLHPNKPIYLVAESPLEDVAARNSCIDLILILSNPGTPFGKSRLQPLLPILEALPNDLHFTVSYLLSFVIGDPVKMAMVNIEYGLSPAQTLERLSGNLAALLPRVSGLSDIIPKESLVWKIELLKSASAYANSRLHVVKAEVLVLASGKDNLLPSRDQVQRLWTSLQNCRVRYFKDNGHTLLLEDGINFLTVIKGTNMYRRTRQHDYILDYLPLSMSEYKKNWVQPNELIRLAAGAVMLSTLEGSKIVRGLSGFPSKGPVLLVGYHMLMGVKLPLLMEEFLREKRVQVRGMAHPMLFDRKTESSLQEFGWTDTVSLNGAVPVSASNMYKLFSTNTIVLLYPGAGREAFHQKSEEYRCFWPNQPEFVRMAARFGATIVPFGVVGEDDIAQYVLDYNDQMKIPIVKDMIEDAEKDVIREIKSEVENLLAYLLKKREEDPYRGIIARTAYKAIFGPIVPSFDP